ncbi:MAG: glycosyltransferase family 9 protein [Pirellulales bacterium]
MLDLDTSTVGPAVAMRRPQREPSLARRAGNVIKAVGGVLRHVAAGRDRRLAAAPRKSPRDWRFAKRASICLPTAGPADTSTAAANCASRRVLPRGTARYRFGRVTRLFPKAVMPLSKETSTQRSLLLFFPHGLGDAVQLTVVLQHLQTLYTQWHVDVATKPGTESLYRGLCRATVTWRLGDAPPNGSGYDQYAAVRWSEPDASYADSPSTKAEKSLREQFGIIPRASLCRYRIAPTDEHHGRADDYVRRIVGSSDGGRQPIVALHYQGNSARARKNLDEQTARRLVETIRGEGYLPMILDWDRRSRLLDLPGVVNPGAGHRLWGPRGTGDAAAIAALIERCAMMIGIDSGPAHIAAATNTPTLVVWRRHHPVHYYCPSNNVTHVVRRDHRQLVRGDADVGQAYFREHYRHVTADAHYRQFLPNMLQQWLRGL